MENELPADKTAEDRAQRVAAEVRKAREAAMMTQLELAIATDLTERTIRRVEQEGRASFETLRAIAVVLRLDIARIHRDVQRANPSPWLAAAKVTGRFLRSFILTWAILLASPLVYVAIAIPLTEVQQEQDAPVTPFVTVNPNGSFRPETTEEAIEHHHGSWVHAHELLSNLVGITFILALLGQGMRIMVTSPSHEAEIIFDAFDRLRRASVLRLATRIRRRTT
jgi:transcriptional regulator with XRE-family HTH domain